MYEVIDWIETGSDHCPIYLRVKIDPKWVKGSKLPVRQILKSSGLKSLRKKLDNAACRASVLTEIEDAFHPLNWSDTVDR